LGDYLASESYMASRCV